jgi:glutamate synthase domain-containing protein 2
MGYALGAKGMAADPDQATFPAVDTGTEFGVQNKVKMKVPIFTGALGSTDIARINWEHFAIGAAISGISLVCGENVCGIDPQLAFGSHGKVSKSPEMDRRVKSYRRFHEGYGDILVQMNVEDTRNGVAEYVIENLGVETIELKWGQGAKCIGGEIKVNSLSRALELKKRGYIVTPDPEDPAHQASFKAGPLKQFERHSRLGFIDQEAFMREVERIRGLGAKRITLKTGAYPMRELAMAIRWSSDAGIDLLTIDGAPGGTGMSPWRMMTEWGVPAIYLHSMAYELCEMLAAKGRPVPDIAFAGGFSSEDHVFKALALGAPYCKAVCMGRALMIPGMVGKNTAKWLTGEEGGLPSTVSKYGFTKEEIFMNYEVLKEKYGSQVEQIPLGAIGIYNVTDKIKVGLQQLMAGSRSWAVQHIGRKDLAALTEECARITGIPYIMDAYRHEALEIINA